MEHAARSAIFYDALQSQALWRQRRGAPGTTARAMLEEIDRMDLHALLASRFCPGYDYKTWT